MKTDYPQENQIPALKRLWKACFSDPESFIDQFFSTGFAPEKSRVLMEGEKIVAALYWFDAGFRGQRLAYLYAVATDPDHRGRGLCRQLMSATHALLKNQGYTAALLLPGEPGLRNMYKKFGYQDCCQVQEFSSEAGQLLDAQEITWEEYGVVRPGFLPEDGADQEGLQFLAAYARFYRGRDYLLICTQEDDRLVGLELLGNKASAPGILAALNCKTGTFRSPGKGRQMAMIFPLAENLERPGYFGLTFD